MANRISTVELASIIINFGLFAATVIAAIITWKGGRDSGSIAT